jgi:hypothetical protein
MYLSSILKMPGRAGNFFRVAGSFATTGFTGRNPYWTSVSWAG